MCQCVCMCFFLCRGLGVNSPLSRLFTEWPENNVFVLRIKRTHARKYVIHETPFYNLSPFSCCWISTNLFVSSFQFGVCVSVKLIELTQKHSSDTIQQNWNVLVCERLGWRWQISNSIGCALDLKVLIRLSIVWWAASRISSDAFEFKTYILKRSCFGEFLQLTRSISIPTFPTLEI